MPEERREISPAIVIVPLVLGLGAAAALGMAALGAGPKPPPPPPPEPGLATVRVTVVDSEGAAISGASVSLDNVTGTTSSSGIIDFTDVAPGTYTLSWSAEGYQPATKTITVAEGTNLFTVQLTAIAPAVVYITLALTNYPAGSFDYDAELAGAGGGGESGVRISGQASLSGPATTTLLVRIRDEAGILIYFEPAVPVTGLEDGAFYLYNCGAKRLIKQELAWSILSENIPAQVAYAGSFMPTATLRLKKDNLLYRIRHWIVVGGTPVGFFSWSFLPANLMSLTQAPWMYLPLNAPNDIYTIQGDNIGAGEHQQIVGPCTLYYEDWRGNVLPVPPGQYAVHREVFWAPAIYDPGIGDVHTIEPRFTETWDQVAILQVVMEDNFVLENIGGPAEAVRGTQVTVSCDVRNSGVAAGSADVVYGSQLVYGGPFVWKTEAVTLGPGEVKTITYTFTVPISEYHGSGAADVWFEIPRFGQRLRWRITTYP